jgi:molecular chaperone GrpE
VTGKKAEKDELIVELENKIKSLQEEIQKLQQKLDEEKDNAEKSMDGWRRAEADYSNYRKRTDQEKGEIGRNTTCAVVYDILPVMDDMDRALGAIPPESQGLPWVEGVQLINKKLRSVLESMGVEEICAVGQTFDPNLHEAVAHLEGEEGAVIDEMQKGYKLRDKLIRPSRVVVGKGTGNNQANDNQSG